MTFENINFLLKTSLFKFCDKFFIIFNIGALKGREIFQLILACNLKTEIIKIHSYKKYRLLLSNIIL